MLLAASLSRNGWPESGSCFPPPKTMSVESGSVCLSCQRLFQVIELTGMGQINLQRCDGNMPQRRRMKISPGPGIPDGTGRTDPVHILAMRVLHLVDRL